MKVRIYVRFFGTLLQLPIGVAGVFAPGFRLPTVRAGFKLLPLLVEQRVVDIGRDLVIGHLHAIRSHAHGKRASTINVLTILDHAAKPFQVLHALFYVGAEKVIEHALFLVRHVIGHALPVAALGVGEGVQRIQLLIVGEGRGRRNGAVHHSVDRALRCDSGTTAGSGGLHVIQGHVEAFVSVVIRLRGILLRLVNRLPVFRIIAVISGIPLGEQLYIGVGRRGSVLFLVPFGDGGLSFLERLIWDTSIQEAEIRVHVRDGRAVSEHAQELRHFLVALGYFFLSAGGGSKPLLRVFLIRLIPLGALLAAPLLQLLRGVILVIRKRDPMIQLVALRIGKKRLFPGGFILRFIRLPVRIGQRVGVRIIRFVRVRYRLGHILRQMPVFGLHERGTVRFVARHAFVRLIVDGSIKVGDLRVDLLVLLIVQEVVVHQGRRRQAQGLQLLIKHGIFVGDFLPLRGVQLPVDTRLHPVLPVPADIPERIVVKAGIVLGHATTGGIVIVCLPVVGQLLLRGQADRRKILVDGGIGIRLPIIRIRRLVPLGNEGSLCVRHLRKPRAGLHERVELFSIKAHRSSVREDRHGFVLAIYYVLIPGGIGFLSCFIRLPVKLEPRQSGLHIRLRISIDRA